jgi:hypothetical protein
MQTFTYEDSETSFSEVSKLKSEKAVALTRLKGGMRDISILAPSFRRFGKAELLDERCGPNWVRLGSARHYRSTLCVTRCQSRSQSLQWF